MTEKGKSARSKQNLKEDKVADLAAKIDETDEMKLKMLAALDKSEPGDSLYPPELNAHLIEQLKVGEITFNLFIEFTNKFLFGYSPRATNNL